MYLSTGLTQYRYSLRVKEEKKKKMEEEEERRGEGREQESLITKLKLYESLVLMLANPAPYQSMKLLLSYHFEEILALFLRARSFTKAQGSCHVRLSSLSDPAPQLLS